MPGSLTSSRKWINPDEMELDEVSYYCFVVFNMSHEKPGHIREFKKCDFLKSTSCV